MLIYAQRLTLSYYNFHILEDWYTWKISVEGIVSMLTPGAVQRQARICNLYMGDWLKSQRESSSITCE